jgi:hypothetical protein
VTKPSEGPLVGLLLIATAAGAIPQGLDEGCDPKLAAKWISEVQVQRQTSQQILDSTALPDAP